MSQDRPDFLPPGEDPDKGSEPTRPLPDPPYGEPTERLDGTEPTQRFPDPPPQRGPGVPGADSPLYSPNPGQSPYGQQPAPGAPPSYGQQGPPAQPPAYQGYSHYPQWAPESAPPPPDSGGSIWAGIGLSVAVWFVLGFVSSSVAPMMGTDPFSISFVVWLAMAIFFSVRPGTRRIGAGMFIAGGIIPVILAGVCVLLIMGASQ